MSSVSVSIVLFRTPDRTLKRVLESLKNSKFPVKVMVVDNSPDPSSKDLVHSFGYEYFFSGKNLGYGSAHNVAIQKFLKSSEYHLILNPDITFGPEVIQSLVEFMDQNEDVGMIAPQILYPDGRLQTNCRLLPSPIDLFARRFLPIKTWVDSRNLRHELLFADHSKKMDVPCLVGCFLLCRVSALKDVGLFDSKIFLYLEDYELCRRMGQKYRLVYYPHVSAVHEYARDSYKNRKLLGYHIRSAIYYFSKTGWIFDSYRRQRNQSTLKDLGFFSGASETPRQLEN